MSDTYDARAARKAAKALKAGKPEKGARPGKAEKAPKPGRAAQAGPKLGKGGLAGWDADGASLSRTMGYATPVEAIKGAKRALGVFQKAGRPVQVGLDGASVTVRISGPVDPDLKKLAKRVSPKDPAKKAARQAAQKAGKAGGDEA